MISEIKDFYSTEINQSLDQFSPPIKDNFGLLIDIEVGVNGNKGSDGFQIMLCTPIWLIENFNKEDFVVGHHYLIVFEYNFVKLRRKLNELFCIEGNNWFEDRKSVV